MTDCDVTMTRVLDAPPSRVFAAWTDPIQAAQWWGPHGFTAPVCEMDVRPGGTFRIHMQGPDGAIYRSKGVYHQVEAPAKLVLTDGFDDEPKPTQDMLWTVRFDPEDGKTKLDIHVQCQSVEDRDTIVKMGWREGTSQMLDRLAAFLAR